MNKSHYDLLGVRPDADNDCIKGAFRKAAKRYHPDLRGGDAMAASRFRQIVAANTVLRDPDRRAEYDFTLRLERSRLRRQRALIGVTCMIAAVISGGIVGGTAVLLPRPTLMAAAGEDVAARRPVAAEAVGEHPVSTASQVAERVAAERRDETEDRDAMPVAGEPIQGDFEATVAGSVAVAPALTHDRELPAGAADDALSNLEAAIIACRTGDLARAAAAFDRAISLDPNTALAYHMRANLRDDMGDHEGALGDYDWALRMGESGSDVYHDRGVSWLRRGALDKALVDLDHAIRFTFSDARIYSDRGMVWYQKRRYDRAVADFSRAIKIDPRFAAYIDRGVILHRGGGCLGARAESPVRIDRSLFARLAGANLP
jgi:tetratricopeptide (TPR) repeat protein